MHVSPSTALCPSMPMHRITGGNCGPDLGCSTHVSPPLAPCAERVESLASLSVPRAAVPSQSAPASYLSKRYVAAGSLVVPQMLLFLHHNSNKALPARKQASDTMPSDPTPAQMHGFAGLGAQRTLDFLAAWDQLALRLPPQVTLH